MYIFFVIKKNICTKIQRLFFKETNMKDSKLYTMGRNTTDHFQCGLETNTKVTEPHALSLPATAKVVQIACGDEHTVFLTGKKNIFLQFLQDAGELYGFGSNQYLQLFFNNVLRYSQPIKMELPRANCQIVQVVAGAAHSMILTSDDQVFGRGYNSMITLFTYFYNSKAEGQLGMEHFQLVPNWQKSDALSNQSAKRIYMCNNVSHMTTKDDRLLAFGLDISGWHPGYMNETVSQITMFDYIPIRFISNGQTESSFVLVTGKYVNIWFTLEESDEVFVGGRIANHQGPTKVNIKHKGYFVSAACTSNLAALITSTKL